MHYDCLPQPPSNFSLFDDFFLAFDPAVSLHYEVFLLTREIQPDQDKVVLSTSVFSSQAKQWASRQFVPQHCGPGNLYDAVTAPDASDVRRWNSAEYWRGSLYVHCWNNVVMILRNSEQVYDMVPLPGKAYQDKKYVTLTTPLRRSVFASYETGVHYVAFEKYQLRIWILRESTDGQVGWMLTHEADLGPYGRQIDAYAYTDPKLEWEAVDSKKAPFNLFKARNIEDMIYDEEDRQSDTCDDDVDDGGQDEEGDAQEDKDDQLKSEEGSDYSWDPDEDNFIDVDESAAQPEDYENYLLLGLHPHKDVVLFLTPSQAVAAYHVMTSKIQYLGKHLVRDPWSFYGANIAFPYRPCYVDALPAPKPAS
ncbi:hypothetical protein ZWY2020_023697 [Hordeum vulgare]|nr:hypothetical protein ZWY2020_029517 [Hordeum vulgare]KAI4983205.1 hypothetical protein ZWY2020_023697 [Hordeum vulgare]